MGSGEGSASSREAAGPCEGPAPCPRLNLPPEGLAANAITLGLGLPHTIWGDQLGPEGSESESRQVPPCGARPWGPSCTQLLASSRSCFHSCMRRGPGDAVAGTHDGIRPTFPGGTGELGKTQATADKASRPGSGPSDSDSPGVSLCAGSQPHGALCSQGLEVPRPPSLRPFPSRGTRPLAWPRLARPAILLTRLSPRGPRPSAGLFSSLLRGPQRQRDWPRKGWGL